MDAHFNEYLAAIAGMADVYGAAAHDHAEDQAAVGGGSCLPRMRLSAGPAAIVVTTHISTQATNSLRSINAAS